MSSDRDGLLDEERGTRSSKSRGSSRFSWLKCLIPTNTGLLALILLVVIPTLFVAGFALAKINSIEGTFGISSATTPSNSSADASAASVPGDLLSVLNAIAALGSNFTPNIPTQLSTLKTAILNAITACCNSLATQMSTGFSTLGTQISTGFGTLGTQLSTGFSTLGSQLSTGFSTLGSGLSALGSQITSGFATLTSVVNVGFLVQTSQRNSSTISILNAITNLGSVLGAELVALTTTQTDLVITETTATQTLITSTSQNQLNNITAQLAAIYAQLGIPCPTVDDILNPKYYCHYSEYVHFFTDRSKNGAYVPSATGRMENEMFFQPSLFKGTGAPMLFPEVRKGYDGTYAAQGYPTFTSTRTIPMERTYTDNVPITDPRPLIYGSGGGASTINLVNLAEHLCSQGYLFVMYSTIGPDTSSCPTASPQCGSAAAGINAFNDWRSAHSLTMQGLNPHIPLSLIKINATDGLPIIGTTGGSAGGNVAIQMAGGLGGGAVLNGFPPVYRLNEALPEVRSVYVGDTFLTPGNLFLNNTAFRASFAIYNHGLSLNWIRGFTAYANAARRLFLQPKFTIHQVSDFSGKTNCIRFRECVRVYVQGVNTPFDDLICKPLISIFGVNAQVAHCAPGTLTNFSAVPGTTYTGAAGLAVEQALNLKTPTTGVSAEAGEAIENLHKYYTTLFFRATLDGDAAASQLVAQNKYPDLLLGVHDNQVPAVNRNAFNLQNRNIQFDLSPDGKYHIVTVSNRTGGSIADPSGNPGATRLSPLSTWSRSTAFPPAAIPLAMGSFPLPTGGNSLVTSTQYVSVSLTGSVTFTGGRSIIDHTYQSPRLAGWMAQSGMATFAMFLAPIGSFGPVNASSPANAIWVENTAAFLRITHYQVSMSNSIYAGYFNFRTTFYPNGTIVQEFDNTIPSNIFEIDQRSAAGVVGYSPGTLYTNPATGKYDATIEPKIRTINDVINGFSSVGGVTFEEFAAGESRQWA